MIVRTPADAYQWTKLARELGRHPAELTASILAMCRALPDLAAEVARRLQAEGLSHPVVPSLAHQIQLRARACAAALEPGTDGAT